MLDSALEIAIAKLTGTKHQPSLNLNKRCTAARPKSQVLQNTWLKYGMAALFTRALIPILSGALLTIQSNIFIC